MAIVTILSRRDLFACISSLGVACASTPALARAMSSPAPVPDRLWLIREHDGMEITTRFRSHAGYDRGAVLELSWIWRDNDDGRAIWIEPRLFDALAVLQSGIDRANGAPLPLVLTSGCRSPAHNAGTEGAARQSTHLDGLAADIRVPGLEPAVVALAAAMCGAGGIGLYPSHVHVDVWRRRFWTDPKIRAGTSLPIPNRSSLPQGQSS